MTEPGKGDARQGQAGKGEAGKGEAGKGEAGKGEAAKKPPPPSAPLWRQAYDAVDKAVTPRAESFVRTPTFATGATVLRRAQTVARGATRNLTARAWHLLNLPAGSDVSRLRAQIGALDREVRRLTVQLETERRRSGSRPSSGPTTPEETRADGAQPADDPRPRPAGRRTQRPAGA